MSMRIRDRYTLANRHEGRCELCDDDAKFILEHHHIVPRSKNGSDSTDNLIALCPSCHAVVEKFRSSIRNRIGFDGWLRNRYSEEQIEKLFYYAFGDDEMQVMFYKMTNGYPVVCMDGAILNLSGEGEKWIRR